MGRKIVIKFGTAKAVAELLEDEAPKTSELIYGLLPVEGKPFHTLESGREIFLQVRISERIVPENQTVHQIPGDLFIYYKPVIYIEPELPEYPEPLSRPVIAFCYGRDTQIRGRYRPLPINIVGTIVEGLEQLEDEAIRLRNEGVEKISFTKL